MNMVSAYEALSALLSRTETKQYYQLKQALMRVKRQKTLTEHETVQHLHKKISQSVARVDARYASFPSLEYDTRLPIVAAKDEIMAAIKNHQVTVICGETGSGKTTQLAKMCLELGLGARGLIGHTQPRRIAARSVATRIAEELRTEIGTFVGYKMRFSDKTQPDTVIKLMTDGILLTELSRDRYLSQYEVIIIDEAHERSLNIDFLLGILKNILPKRPDLKVIITSATIDPDRFACYFSHEQNHVPVIEVSGRTYPVEIRYRGLITEDDSEDLSQAEGIVNAVHELSREQPGDILVFLPGEREIREMMELLQKEFQYRYDVLPLFSRLSQAEQNRIFAPHQKMRIILSTNVAETSLTVPGIKYVIDTGVARVSRYSPRSRLQRLLVEPIARASANQRSGRCGRVSEGICIRLYSAEDFETRPEFLAPEMLRTHLAAVILQMAHLHLGDPHEFPFIEAPDTRQIREGYQTLRELRAIDEQNHLTKLGKQLANLPLDPRFGAMIFEGLRLGVGHELIVMVALLSIQNPNERPLDKQQAADEKHRLFKDKTSDFIGYLNLWSWYQQKVKTHSQSQLRALCRKHFISYLRMREWYELYQQILQIIGGLKYQYNDFPVVTDEHLPDASDYLFPGFAVDVIHQALLVGLLDHIGMLGEEGIYAGASGQKFRIFPGSSLYRKPPKWLMAMEIVETSQVYARMCAGILPQWLETLGAHLIKRQYHEPHWRKSQGQAFAYETVLLFNLAIVRQRLMAYGQIDPELSRELMIKEGLVQGEIITNADFYRKNLQVMNEVEQIEDKTRRRDILVEEWKRYEWYDQQIPAACYSVKHLEKWCKIKANNERLIFTRNDLLASNESLNLEDFPEVVQFGDLTLNALYLFDPAHEDDGMTVLVPIAALNLLDQTRLDWLSKGLLLEKITALLRSLPKAIRRNFVPLPDYAQRINERLTFAEGNLLYQLSRILSEAGAVSIEPHEFDEKTLPKHLRMNIRIIDGGGKIVAQGRDLEDLKTRFSVRAESAFQALVTGPNKLKSSKPVKPVSQDISVSEANVQEETIFQTEHLDPENWQVPAEAKFMRNHIYLTGYVALVQTDHGLATRFFDRKAPAKTTHLDTLIALSLHALRDEIKYLQKQWPNFGKMALMFRSVGTESILKADLMRALVKDHFTGKDLPRTAAELTARINLMRRSIISEANTLSALVIDILVTNEAIKSALMALNPHNRVLIFDAIEVQRKGLVHADFISQTDKHWRVHIPRFLKAMQVRIERFSQNISRDQQLSTIIVQHQHNYQKAYAALGIFMEELNDYRWLIEELCVSFFAQPMKTSVSVSEKKLDQLWEKIALSMKNWRG